MLRTVEKNYFGGKGLLISRQGLSLLHLMLLQREFIMSNRQVDFNGRGGGGVK